MAFYSSFLQISLIVALANQTLCQSIQLHLRSHSFVKDTNIISSSQVSDKYQVLTFDNKFKLLIIVSPKFAGHTAYGILSNFGGLDNPTGFSRLDQLLINTMLKGSKDYPELQGLDDFLSLSKTYSTSYSQIFDSAFISTVPSAMSTQTISRINDAYLNPLFSEEALQAAIQELDQVFSTQKQSLSFKSLFYNFYGQKDLSSLYTSFSTFQSEFQGLMNGKLNQILLDYYYAYINPDNMVGLLAFEQYDHSLVQLIINGLGSMPNTNASAKINKGGPLRALNDSSRMYIRLNSSEDSSICFNIIPVQGMRHQQTYQWIVILSQLVNSANNGLIKQLENNFPQILQTSNAQVHYLNRNKYPYLQIIISFSSFSPEVGPKIYNFIQNYFNQNWSKIYEKNRQKVISGLEYKFNISPFNGQSLLDENDVLYQYLKNLANEDVIRVLDASYYIDRSLLNESSNNYFKIVAIEKGRLGQIPHGTDAYTGLNYQYVGLLSTLVETNQSLFNTQGTVYKDQLQNWLPFSNSSIVIAPTKFADLPFSSVTAIIHFNTSGIDPHFAQVFFGLLLDYLSNDTNVLYDSEAHLLVERQIYSLTLIDLRQKIFLVLNKLFNTSKTIFYTEQNLNNKFLELTSQSLKDSSSKYGFTQFQADQQMFIKTFQVQWLLISFKNHVGINLMSINNLHSNLKLKYYDFQKEKIKRGIENRLNEIQDKSFSLLFIDYGPYSQTTFVQIQIIDLIVTPLISKFCINNCNQSRELSGSVHLTLDGKIGYNIYQAGKDKISSALLLNLLDFIGNELFIQMSNPNYSKFYDDIAKKLLLQRLESIEQETRYLLQYIFGDCYDCIMVWPAKISSSYSNKQLDQAKANAIKQFNGQLNLAKLGL